MYKKETIIYPLFSKPLMAFSLSIDSDKIFNHIKKLSYKNTTAKGCYSSLSKKVLENKNLKEEKNIFLNAIKDYLNLLGYKQEFKILNSWSTKVEKNCESHSHVHTNTWLSGVYYVQDNSSIQFIKSWSNSSFFKLGYNSNNIYSAADWDVTVKKNTLLIFPSELSHKVKKNCLKKNRYSLAFNILPVGTFNKGSDSEITYA
jgi:uncharacterized protein (TIGR02466 family)|tara:strand:- start:779 stop:1384 length:606 start_codon:yes stop_codon:yes gene_type:complete